MHLGRSLVSLLTLGLGSERCHRGNDADTDLSPWTDYPGTYVMMFVPGSFPTSPGGASSYCCSPEPNQ